MYSRWEQSVERFKFYTTADQEIYMHYLEPMLNELLGEMVMFNPFASGILFFSGLFSVKIRKKF